MRESGATDCFVLFPHSSIAQNRLLSAGWRHECRMPVVSLKALWPSSSSFIKAHTAFWSRQRTYWNWLAHVWRLPTQMLGADRNADSCYMASACQLTKLGIDRFTCTWISHHILCLYARVPIPCQRPDWNGSYGEGGALIEGFQTPTLINTPCCDVDTFTPQTFTFGHEICFGGNFRGCYDKLHEFMIFKADDLLRTKQYKS